MGSMIGCFRFRFSVERRLPKTRMMIIALLENSRLVHDDVISFKLLHSKLSDEIATFNDGHTFSTDLQQSPKQLRFTNVVRGHFNKKCYLIDFFNFHYF